MSNKLRRSIHKKLGWLLHMERFNRGELMSEVSEKTRVSYKTVDRVELGILIDNWQKIGRLLDYYNKEIKITLTDKE